jgi:hypothetical protein
MTSYLYDRTGNVIVEVSPDDHILYSFYDGFSRLRYVKNQNGEYLVSYCYNKAGQPIDCEASGTPPSFTPPPIIPIPTPPPLPPVSYRRTTSSSTICSDTSTPSYNLFFNVVTGLYYFNSSFGTIATTGYYREPGSNQYLYIVNGLLTSTGLCPPD